MPSSKNVARRVASCGDNLKGAKFGAPGIAESTFRLDPNVAGTPAAEKNLKGEKVGLLVSLSLLCRWTRVMLVLLD